MGIIKISEQMHENLRLTSGALSRSMNAQAEHWLRVGMLSELNPTLCHGEICQLLIESERQAPPPASLRSVPPASLEKAA